MDKKKFYMAFAVLAFAANAGYPQNINQNKDMKYQLAPLPYAHTALEPWLDATTVSLHHDKHQAAYVNNLNAALEKAPDFVFEGELWRLLQSLDTLPESIRTAVRNNGGGVFNHEFYWGGLGGEPTVPSKQFADALAKSFGSVENFKREMTEKSASIFGSGYAWLCADSNGNLKIITAPNQDNPYTMPASGGGALIPIFCIDVWEHSYYLKYQNLRGEYLKNIWQIVNWAKLSDRYERALIDSKPLM